MKLPSGKLTKISDDKFGGMHPRFIFEGYVKEGLYFDLPEVGYSFYLNDFRTSTVTEITTQTEKEMIFKTLNSTYKLEFDKND